MDSTVETIDGLIAVTKKTAKSYFILAAIIAVAAVVLFTALLLAGQMSQLPGFANVLVGIGSAPPVLLGISQRQRVGVLQIQRRRAVQACSDPAELKCVADDTNALVLTLAGK